VHDTTGHNVGHRALLSVLAHDLGASKREVGDAVFLHPYLTTPSDDTSAYSPFTVALRAGFEPAERDGRLALRLPATDTSPEMITAGNHLMPETLRGHGQVARALVVFADNLDGYVDDLIPVWRTSAEEVAYGLRVRRTTTPPPTVSHTLSTC
jgi:hypothetical protein